MKRYIFFASVIIALTGACKNGEDFLDKTETTNLNEQTVFADSALTMQFLTRIYSDIGFSSDPKRFGGSIGIYSISDEAEMAAVGGAQWNVRFLTGNVSALQIPSDAWNTTYENIRRVNVLLFHLPETPLSANLRAIIEGEARFLRAWYYFILVKHYGGIPLVGDLVFGPEDEVPGKRNSFEECVSYIETECNAAAALLPAMRTGLDYGRINKIACLALKSRLLLYAASPLFNGRREVNASGSLVPLAENSVNPVSPELRAAMAYPSYDRSRWEKAAQAAADAMTGPFSLYEDNTTAPGFGFQRVFTMRVNNEYILAKMSSNNRYIETTWDPPSRTGSGSGFPYQELVDAFGTINGKPISEDIMSASNPNGYDPANPYNNRDPRLGWTVIYNDMVRLNTSRTMSPVYTYEGAASDGYSATPGSAQTRTGYYIRKMLDENTIASTTSPVSERCLPLIRFAEVLLNRAEALNELNDSPPEEVYELLGRIRKRAGIAPGPDGLYGLTDDMSQSEMRTVIQNERRIELAFEEHRYWDVRRWGIAGQIANKTLHGMRITSSGSGYAYQLVDVRTPVFQSPKWYFWPIPQSEINKSKELEQSPEW